MAAEERSSGRLTSSRAWAEAESETKRHYGFGAERTGIAEKAKLMKRQIRLMAIFLTILLTGIAIGQDSPRPDATRLRLGKFEYRDTVDGKPAGTATIAIRRTREQLKQPLFEFSAVAKFATGVSKFQTQSWESEASAAMEPVSASLTFGAGANAARQFFLRYSTGKVCGATPAAPVAPDCALSAEVPVDIVDQRVDWAAVMSLALAPGRHFEFHVYDPKTGVSAVGVDVGAAENAAVPAGNFEVYRVTYRIEKSTGAEKYQLSVTKDVPRFMVGEDFPNGDVSELVKISPK